MGLDVHLKAFLVVVNGKGVISVRLKIASRLIRPSTHCALTVGMFSFKLDRVSRVSFAPPPNISSENIKKPHLAISVKLHYQKKGLWNSDELNHELLPVFVNDHRI